MASITADGNSDLNYVSGEVFFSAEGTFGGGTITVELSKDGVNYGEVTGSSLTANGGFSMHPGDGFTAGFPIDRVPLHRGEDDFS